MKKFIFACACIFISVAIAEDEDSYFEDMDSLFDKTVDKIVEDSSINLKDRTEQLSNVVSQVFKFPVRFSGNLDAQLGFVYWPEDREKSLYFDFTNNYVMTAVPKDYLTITTDLKLAYTNGFKAEISQVYFDYIPFQHFFIDGGKRSRSLTAAKIFTSTTDFLIDSKESMSGSITFTLGSFSLSAKGLYHIAFVDPSAEYADKTVETQIEQAKNDANLINYVFNMEFIAFNTNFNFFARKWQSSYKSNNGNSDLGVFNNYFYYGGTCPNNPKTLPWTWGLQVRKTIFGADCYFQGTINFNLFNGRFKRDEIEGLQFLAGLYKYWEYDFAKFGFNAEYHYLFDEREGIPSRSEFGLTGGISKLFHDHLALAVTWKHDYESQEGSLTPGIILSNVVKGGKIEIGSNIAYGKDKDTLASIGIKLNLSVSY